MRKLISSIVFSVILGGCVSEQLNYDTLDLASSSDTLLTKQILYNLSAFLDSDVANPAQVVVSAGTASTTNTVTPSLSFPLTNGLSVVSGGARTVTTAAAGGTIGGTNATAQNWGFSAITDPYEFRRLQALYRYAIDSDDARLIRSYPLTFKTVSRSQNLCLIDESSHKCAILNRIAHADKSYPYKGVDYPYYNEKGEAQKRPPDYAGPWPPNNGKDQVLKFKADSVGSDTTEKASGGSESYSLQVPDEFFLRLPNCVLCLRPGYPREGKLSVNRLLRGSWLRWRSLAGAARESTFHADDIFLGHMGHYDLYVDRAQADHWNEFVVQILAASTQSAFSGSSGAPSTSGGGTSSGGATKPLTSLLLPAAPVLTLSVGP